MQLLLTLVAALGLQSSAPFEVKGVAIGMTQQQLHDRWGKSAHCTESVGDALRDRACSPVFAGDKSFAGVADVTISASFYGDRVAAITVLGIPVQRFLDVRMALEAKFGAPASDEMKEIENRAGAKFTNSVVTWVSGDQILELRQRAASLDESGLTLTAKATMAEFERRRLARAKAALSDM